jgi:hypothetical protein
MRLASAYAEAVLNFHDRSLEKPGEQEATLNLAAFEGKSGYDL